MAIAEQIIKVVVVSVHSRGGYSRHVIRVVQCRSDQRGYRSERGVRVLATYGPFYRVRTASGRGKGPDAYREATAYAEQLRLEALGV